MDNPKRVNMEETEIQEKMATALRLARESWEKANMPPISRDNKETRKISLAILATKIFDQLGRK